MVAITSILQCPISKSPLQIIDADSIHILRQQINRGERRHITGKAVLLQLDVALSSSDGQFIYPVVDGIFLLLPSLAIVSQAHLATYGEWLETSATEDVMRFYDEIGWQVTQSCEFQDAKSFEDLRPVSKDYIQRCHRRVSRYLPTHGTYLLDVASGPVQYPEYVRYSDGYNYRICADVSITALRAAQQNLGDRGLYVQCDMTQLPFQDGTIDSFVSLHTVYHIPATKQVTAFRELERVLQPNGTGVVVYAWATDCLPIRILMAIRSPYQSLRRIVPRSLADRLKTLVGKPRSSSFQPEENLYFYPHSYDWFQQNVAAGASSWTVNVWRSVSVPFLRQYIYPWLLGKQLLALLFRLENAFPQVFGRFGHYPLLVYRKPTTKP